LQVPSDYEILFLQGGATMQFSMLAMNWLEKRGDYISTGHWSEKAIEEARSVGEVRILASSKAQNFSSIPKNVPLDPSSDYLHITSNNTIFGTQYKEWPFVEGCPLIIDASSDIMSKPIDFKGVGMIYAGAQKNIGPSGVVLVIIRKDLSKKVCRQLPDYLKYCTHVKAGSMSNTPPTFAIYMVKLVMDWLHSIGGVEEMQKRNEEKAAILYRVIDDSDFYTGTAVKEDRSLMNVTFTLPSEQLTDSFLKMCKERGLENLKGYRTVGGIRASIYNAMPMAGVQALVDCMKDFVDRNG